MIFIWDGCLCRTVTTAVLATKRLSGEFRNNILIAKTMFVFGRKRLLHLQLDV